MPLVDLNFHQRMLFLIAHIFYMIRDQMRVLPDIKNLTISMNKYEANMM